MTQIVELVRKGIIEDAASADARRVFAMAMALCEPPIVQVQATLDLAAAQPRFVVLGDEVRDNETGLIWTRKTIGKHNWADAQKAAAEVNLGGHQWRLPTRKELLTLVDDERFEPAINPVFECNSGWYWTSTPWASSPGVCAWVVSFNFGYAYGGGQSYNGFVRAVRVGQF